jgi:hypothetical protein
VAQTCSFNKEATAIKALCFMSLDELRIALPRWFTHSVIAFPETHHRQQEIKKN